MMIPMEFVALFLTGALAAMGSLVKYLMGAIKQTNLSLQGISEHLAKLNGRVGKSETWQSMHEKQDDERHEVLTQDIHELQLAREQ